MSLNICTATVESHLPGRLRVRVPREHRQECFFDHVKDALLEIDGVLNVVINTSTGSALVEYNPELLAVEEMLELGRKAGILNVSTAPVSSDNTNQASQPPSEAAANIIKSFRKIDRTLYRVTRGTIDGKMAVSLLLLGSALGKAMFAEKRQPAPWHSLLWYSYSTFMQWHNPAKYGKIAP